jgi:serine/threonine protein kinase
LSSNPLKSLTELSVDLLRQVDLVCDDYERQLRQGQRPTLESLLSRTPEDVAQVLRAELALVEVDVLRESDASVTTPAEIASRVGLSLQELQNYLQDSRAVTRHRADAPTQGLERLGEYMLGEKLSDGGMGSVYRARHQRLGRLVAVKLIRSDFGNHPTLVARFEREMRAIGALEHPNVIEALDAGEHRGQLYLVMRLLEGQDVARLVTKYGPLRPADAAEIIRQAALGLQYLHERGLVHRDVKPSNLFLTNDGTVKLLDLGLAKWATSHDRTAELTSAGVMLGTVDFIAPEQQVDATTVTIAADIYALGCTLYALLAGKSPFHGYHDAEAKLAAHRSEPPPDLSLVQPELPRGMHQVLERMLAKNPGDRYAEPRQVAEALAAFTAGAELPTLARFPAGVQSATPLPERGIPARKSRSWSARAFVLAALLALTALCIYGVWRYTRNPPRPPPVAEEKVEPLRIPIFRVNHYAVEDGLAQNRGQLGADSFGTRFGDQVSIHAELSASAYCYLLALNANGSIQLCSPEGTQALTAQRRLEFPAGGKAADLTDEPRGGVQAFALIASSKPLPEFETWRSKLPELAWSRVPATQTGVWRWQGNAREELQPVGTQRINVSELAGLGTLTRTVEQLRKAPGVEAIAVVAFTVAPHTSK